MPDWPRRSLKAQGDESPAQDTARQVITRVARSTPLPLSFAQERMWFLYQLSPDAAAYNIPASVRLHGPLNKAALRWSVSELVRRHDAFRTTFTKADGQPRQVIHASLEPLWTDEDLRVLPKETRETRALELATAEARRPFDLDHGPLLRILLIQLDEEEHVLMMNAHHIISDLWSFGIIARELVTCYNSFCAGNSHAPSAYTRYSICRFRPMATRMAHRIGAGGRTRALEVQVTRSSHGGSAGRSTAVAGSFVQRRSCIARSVLGVGESAQATQRPRRGDAVHGVLGGVFRSVCIASRTNAISSSARRSPIATDWRSRILSALLSIRWCCGPM